MRWIIIVGGILILLVIAGLQIVQSKRATPPFGNLNQKLDHLIADFVAKDSSIHNCVLSVMKSDGSFAWTGAAGVARQDGGVPMTPDTPIYIASITKLYTATAVMRLYEAGALSLSDPMAKYLPDDLIGGIHLYRGKDYSREITIHQLLSHTSGIADYYSEKPEGGKGLFEVFLEEPAREWTVEETIAWARTKLHPNFPPGTDASYSDTNFQLLGKIVETVTGKPLHVVFDEFFFRPLALDHTWLVGRSQPRSRPAAAPANVFYDDRNITTVRANGSYWADGGIASTAEECIIFLKALNEGRLIRPETLRLMHDWHKLHFPIQYGYGTMYFKFPRFMRMVMKVPPLWGHSGSSGSFLYYSEDHDLYLAGTINQTESKIKPFRLMGSVIEVIQSKE